VDPRPTPRDPEKPLTGPQGFRGSFERTL
jgi:hypothetical protein